MNKRLPVFYLSILWLVAIVTVFFIIRPMVSSPPDKKLPGKNSGRNLPRGMKDSSSAPVKNNERDSGIKQEQVRGADEDQDLIFYDKTAFIRYFNNKYSEEELTASYDKALAERSNETNNGPIRVVKKGPGSKTRKSFSGSFDIRPVPVN